MTRTARLIAVLAGCACLVLAGVELVRQAALAADPTISWPVPEWWESITADAPRSTTPVAAAALAGLAVFLIILAVCQLGERRRGPELVQFASEGCRAQLSVPGLEGALARRVQSVLPGVEVARLDLRKSGPGWRVRLEAVLPPGDSERLRRRALETLRGDLRRIAGMELTRLDIVVTAVRGKRRDAS